MKSFIDTLHSRRWAHLAVSNLRILLGFAFLPSGLKKVLGQPFTDPQNTGAFHEFLHAFHATGFFYPFVGAVQLTIAVLLMTQTFAALGALMALPVMTTILVFCWSTGVVPTAVVTTFMFLGFVALLVWDIDRLLPIIKPGHEPSDSRDEGQLIDLSLWRACGAGIVGFYGLACLAYGGVYRPKGMDLGHPAFYVLIVIALCPLVTWLVERRSRARSGRA